MKRITSALRYWAAGLLIVFGVLLVMAEADDRQARQEQQLVQRRSTGLSDVALGDAMR